MIVRRLSQDWQAKYGHPILLLETFVDRRFQGTCYQAANWQCVGQTTGRTRNGTHIGSFAQVKEVYLHALHDQALPRLRHAR